jgi:threonylcarbamoyladenosine tRNA methylthiotransferase MtaB
MSRFFIWTFGCRSNQADSAGMREGLLRLSMTESETFLDADVIIINTCTVTHRSDKQIRQIIRRIHRENPSARVLVTGCYAQRDPEAVASLPGVRLVLGNREKPRLPEFLKEIAAPSESKIFCASLDAADNYEMPSITHTSSKRRPLVKLQDGCDGCCAYCIVPYVRGPGHSARPEDVLAEIQSLSNQGYQEIVLTGINLGAYGRRINGHARLIDLLRRIVGIPELGRIRLSSIEPIYLDYEIIKLAANHQVFARHFHIPIQSGSDRILRLMRRPYTTDQFHNLLSLIHQELPDAGLGTDVLIGFPGETEQDFEETCSLLEEMPLSYLHAFPFSPREGTEAFSLPDRVPSHIMKRRLHKVLEIGRSKNLAFRQQFQEQILPAVTLDKEEEAGESVVLTHNFIHARVSNLTVSPNQLVEVRIEEIRPDATYATLVSETEARTNI